MGSQSMSAVPINRAVRFWTLERRYTLARLDQLRNFWVKSVLAPLETALTLTVCRLLHLKWVAIGMFPFWFYLLTHNSSCQLWCRISVFYPSPWPGLLGRVFRTWRPSSSRSSLDSRFGLICFCFCCDFFCFQVIYSIANISLSMTRTICV